MQLNTASPVPLYHQLAEILRRGIESRAWPSGARLPSEFELCRDYGVTRPTVRQALDGLVREGRVFKRRGVGAFVAAARVPVGLFSLVGTTEAFARQRLRVRTRLLSAETVAGCPLAEEDRPPRRWLRLERLRAVRGTRALYERTWILAACVPAFDPRVLEDGSLYACLRVRYGLEAEGGAQRFEAVAASRAVARVLRGRPGAPVLRVVRILDLTGHPGAFRVELFAAQGPFVLEERIPGQGANQEFATAVPYQEETT